MVKRRGLRALAGGLVAALVLSACGSDDGDTLVVGSANFPESVMLAHMYALALEDIGVDVEVRTNIGAREVYFRALQQGEIDLFPEYTGSLLNFLSDGDLTDTSTEGLIAGLRAVLGDDIQVLEPSDAENRNGLVITRELSERLGITTTSQLAQYASELVAGGAPETRERADGLPGYERVYGIRFADWIDLDPGGPLTVAALQNGDIDVARLFTSQGVIAASDWVVLEDDGGLIPSENIVPVIRTDALTDEIRAVLNAISAALTLDELIAMNRRVEIDNDDPDLVAAEWLVANGFRS
jgi:osmoprotectant transport system substrate-binding protein